MASHMRYLYIEQITKTQVLLWTIPAILYIYLFIKVLQHRPVGHQVLQPAKDVELGQYV